MVFDSLKVFDKSSIGCALSSVHDEIEKQALLQGKIYIPFLLLKLILRLCVPLVLVFDHCGTLSRDH